MDFRLAVMENLPQLKSVFTEIIKNMDDNQIKIWDNNKLFKKRNR